MLVDAEIYVMFEPDHIFDACTWTCQIESESSLPRAADRAKEGSKIGLRSDLRASNLKKNFSLEGEGAVAYFCTQSHTQPNQFNFASTGPG